MTVARKQLRPNQLQERYINIMGNRKIEDLTTMHITFYNNKEQLSIYITLLHIHIDVYYNIQDQPYQKYLNMFISNNKNSGNNDTTCGLDIEFSTDASMNISTQNYIVNQSLG